MQWMDLNEMHACVNISDEIIKHLCYVHLITLLFLMLLYLT